MALRSNDTEMLPTPVGFGMAFETVERFQQVLPKCRDDALKHAFGLVSRAT